MKSIDLCLFINYNAFRRQISFSERLYKVCFRIVIGFILRLVRLIVIPYSIGFLIDMENFDPAKFEIETRRYHSMDFYELGQLYESGADKGKIFAAMEEIGLNATEENNRTSTLLHIAARYADAVTLKKLLDAGLEANAKNKYGENALFCLADPFERYGFLPSEDKKACASLLLEAGASVMARSEGDGQTVFTSAGIHGQWELIDAAVAHGSKLTRTNENGENVLHCTLDYARQYNDPFDETEREMQERYFQLVKILYESGFDMDEKDGYGRSPLEYAKDCTDKRLAALIEGTYSENTDKAELTGGLTLQEAIERKDYDAIRNIAADGSDLNEIADDGKWKGRTPLSVACSYLDERAVELLLASGADPNFKSADGQTCLYQVLHDGETADYDFIHREDQNTVCKKILSLLLSAGMDQDAAIDDGGDTALIAACRRANQRDKLCYKFAVALIALKCSLDAANLKGQNALMLISAQNGADANELQIALLEAGASVTESDQDGNTALHYAARNVNDSVAKEMAEMLFEFDFSDTDAVNNDGKTALEIAIEQNNEPLVKLILMNLNPKITGSQRI